MSPPPIRRICIVGGGSAGWMTAATLARLLGPSVEVTLVESHEIGIVGVGEATIPQMATFNRMLGLDEDDFIRKTKGSFKLGIEFVDWREIGHRYFHPFGSYGVNMGGVSFHAYWLRMHELGEAPDLDPWSLQALAAKSDRFMRSIDAGRSPLSEIAYAYHFDATLYARYLRDYAEARGVKRQEGRIVDVALRGSDGFVEAVVLADGRRVEAEFFIDCSGFRGLLIAGAMGAEWVDWSHWLPCKRAVAVPCAGGERLPPYTRATARTAGWQWRIPLQHRIGNGHVFSTAHMSEDEATAILLANLDGEPLAEPRTVPFRAGHRDKLWIKNVVAVGLASGFLEPLESTSLWLVQSGLSRLLTMFPDTGFDPADRARYNRILATEYAEIRDFIILHYHATRRDDSAFWRHVRTMAIPDRLAEKIRVFESRGRTFRENEELFNDTSWFAVMVGQGLQPRGHDPVASVMSEAETRRRLASIRETMASSADYMPDHRAFIRDHCAADGL